MFRKHIIRLAILLVAAGAIGGMDGARRGLTMPDTSNLDNELPETLRRPAQSATPDEQPTASGSEAQPGASVATAPAPTEDKADGKGMTSAELRNAWLDQSVTLIDARPLDQYTEAHIPDSISLPFEDFDSRFLTISAVLDPSGVIVVYCDGGDCHASHNVAALLRDMGFDQIIVYERGFASWLEAGYEIQSGDPWI